jgi:hypothetical protein
MMAGLMTVKRPLSVTIIGCLYILVGCAGLAYHFSDFRAHPLELGGLGVEFVRVLAIVAGVFLLRGANWARWLALVWMAFHVGIGYLNGWTQMLTHAVFLAIIAFFLLSRPANEYFTNNYSTQAKEA